VTHDPIDVLIVEDNTDHAELLRLQLGQSGDAFGRIESTSDLAGALRSLCASRFDAVLLDLNLPDSRGIDTVARMCAQAPDPAVVVTTSEVDHSLGLKAIHQGAQDYLVKGILTPVELRRAVVHAVQRQREQLATARLAAIVDESDDAILSATPDGTVLTWNQGAERIFGYSVSEARGRPLEVFFPASGDPEYAQRCDQLQRGEAIRSRDMVVRRKDGGSVDVSVTVTPIHVGRGTAKRVTALALVARDVSDRKRAERALRASEEQYRLLFDNNPQPMWVYDGDSMRFLAVNDAAVRHYGYSREEFVSMTLRDIRPPEELPDFEAQVRGRRDSATREAFDPLRTWRHRRKDGSLIEVAVSVSPIRFEQREAWLVLAIDVTERRRLEAQLLQAQKMESIGRLAAGIAHDFNNLLGVITGFGELARRQIADGDPVARRLDEILKAASKAAELTRQLLAFSRKQVLELRVLDLGAVLADMDTLLRRLIGEHIQLVTIYAQKLGHVRADAGQLSQVIVNLALNARDAMPQGGRLIVETADVDLDESYAAGRPEVRPGRYVMLSVSDTGVGMAAETLARIFEPFFTTKEAGRGTGLGLATVYGIIKQLGGNVWTYSELGRGTSFRIYLPRVDEAVQPAEPRSDAGVRGTETILVVEDDEALRSIIAEVLGEHGYSVLTACNGTEALAEADRDRRPIDLVISDMVMPGMGGDELSRRLGSLRFLFMSGYTEASAQEGSATLGAAFLQKPFTPGTLLRKAREALEVRK
jgi:two-component system cell cycle sensor histidine kinase/response regulator CckA